MNFFIPIPQIIVTANIKKYWISLVEIMKEKRISHFLQNNKSPYKEKLGLIYMHAINLRRNGSCLFSKIKVCDILIVILTVREAKQNKTTVEKQFGI